jgi:hypothetical protein
MVSISYQSGSGQYIWNWHAAPDTDLHKLIGSLQLLLLLQSHDWHGEQQ